MKKFSFALDKVLGYKQQLENSLRNEHAAIMQQVNAQEEKIRKLQEEDAATRHQLEEDKRKGCTILKMRSYEGYLEHLMEEIAKANQILEVLKVKEEKKREELIAAKTETASIDKLKEKKLEEYNHLAQKEQEQLVEEFVNHELTLIG